MELNDFLRLLHGVKGPNGSGEYSAKCPAHEDKTASLSIKAKEGSILLNCHAGCSNKAIVESLGIAMRDLFYGDKTSGKKEKEKAKNKPQSPAPAVKEKETPKDFGTLTKVYDYTDEEGKVLFQVCRYTLADGSKTFRQRVPDPSKKGGFNWSTRDVRKPLYNLPLVLDAINNSKPVFVVEGEKDADNLAKLGFVATTNCGGASKEGGPKWTQENYETLKGAVVYIIPDNDNTGMNDRKQLAVQLKELAEEVYLLDLTQLVDGLPNKGDVTDFIDMVGAERAKSEIIAFTKTALPYSPNDLESIAAAYGRIPGYTVENRQICTVGKDENYPLCNFVAAPTYIVTKDDGVQISKELVIKGFNYRGTPLPEVMIPASKFAQMNWVMESWDVQANIMPGTSAKDKLRYIMTSVGDLIANRTTIYQHTGWRNIRGEWAYLYQGGAIGTDGVSVDLGSGLGRYSLKANEEEVSLDEGQMASMMLQKCFKEELAIPLLCMMYLAPLRHFLEEEGVPPGFSLFVLGGSGTGKSTAIALALSHFGQFTGKTLPASFNDTANFVRKKAFFLKDMPIVVDDYHPVTSMQERKRMESTAQSLSRAFGDGAERGRMKSDLSLQESNPPRGVSILSGEDMPNIGESGVARYFIVNVKVGDVPLKNMEGNEVLTYMQDMASKGVLSRAMRGYIKWLLPQVNGLGKKLHGRFLGLRAEAMGKANGEHARAAEAVAHMMLGYEMMLNYFVETGFMNYENAQLEKEKAWKALTKASHDQGEEMSSERPSKMFLSAINEMLISKAAAVQDLTNSESHVPVKGMIGYKDNSTYYLMPEMSYKEITKMYAEQGQAFPLSRKMLYKQMKEDGYLMADDTAKVNTKPKNINGKSQRLLWIPRVYIEGEERPTQLTMEAMKKGFVPVEDNGGVFDGV